MVGELPKDDDGEWIAYAEFDGIGIGVHSEKEHPNEWFVCNTDAGDLTNWNNHSNVRLFFSQKEAMDRYEKLRDKYLFGGISG